MKDKLFHYTECGLDNVYLSNGYSIDKDGALFIEDILGLHRAIGFSLVHCGRKLKGKEIRFIRHYMDVSQKTLGEMLGVEYLTVLRWEKGEIRITVMADRFLKILFIGYLNNEATIKEAVDNISDIDNNRCEEIELSHRKGQWKNAA